MNQKFSLASDWVLCTRQTDTTSLKDSEAIAIRPQVRPNLSHVYQVSANESKFNSNSSNYSSLEGQLDELNDDGYQVFDNIRWEYPPVKIDKDGNRVYQFPGCFIIHVGVKIPKGVDKNDFGLQLIVYNEIVGLMQCDPKAECKDKQTANQPEPPWYQDGFSHWSLMKLNWISLQFSLQLLPQWTKFETTGLWLREQKWFLLNHRRPTNQYELDHLSTKRDWWQI